MTISELIKILEKRKQQHGDLDIKIDCSADGLRDIEEIDVPADDDSLVIWVESAQ